MVLEILYKDNRLETKHITVAWQDIHSGMDRLYVEAQYDDPGKGSFIDTGSILTWKITQSGSRR